MNPEKEILQDQEELTDDEKLDHALTQMEALYRSRCVQSPLKTNVVVTEIDDEE